jgi:SAM-dependent methyltransferase
LDNRLKELFINDLACPACAAKLEDNILKMTCKKCLVRYPVVDGIPVLIDESKSLFSHADFIKKSETFFVGGDSLRNKILEKLPKLTANLWAKDNFSYLSELLAQLSHRPRILIIGGGIMGKGMQTFRSDPRFDFIDTDVSHGPMTKLICDGHDLPFRDGTFDAVIAQAVFEHVANPNRVAAEVCRVLRQGGYVYADTPFLQCAHATPYDFHRFTFIGYRLLFAHWDVVRLQPVGGPGHVLATAWQNLLLCFTNNRILRGGIYIFAALTAFWLKYLDKWLNRNPYALHTAYGLLFIGRKRDTPLTVAEVVHEMRAL